MVRHNLLPQYIKDPLFPEIIPVFKTKVKHSDMVKINSSREIHEYALKTIPEHTIEYIEHFTIIMFNRAQKIMGYVTVSVGGINMTVVDPKVVFGYALSCGASSIALCHNHPSGSSRPSEQDIRLTKRIKEGCDILDIGLLDHIILSQEETYFSFADEGML